MLLIIDLSLLEKDIISQPKILDKMAPKIWRETEKVVEHISKAKSIILTGCGDSLFSSIAGKYMLESIACVPSIAENSYEFTNYSYIPKDSLLVAISASGRTRTTVEAVRKAEQLGIETIAITCNPNGEILKYSKHSIVIDVRDSVPVPTITSIMFLWTLAAFSILIGHREGNLDEKKFEELKAELFGIDNKLKNIEIPDSQLELVSRFIRKKGLVKPCIYLIGGGPNFSTALFGMAKLRELNIAHSIAFELEEFLHYGNIPLTENELSIIIACGKSVERGNDAFKLLQLLNAGIITISTTKIGGSEYIAVPNIEEVFSPILCLHAIQRIAADMAHRIYGEQLEIRHGEAISRIIRICSAEDN